MTENPSNELSPNKLALLKIRELKQLLANAQQNAAEPIAIVSMACRFPRRSSTPEEFWQCLMDQTDEVSEIPADRWDLDAFYNEDPEFPGKMYARQGVFLDNLDLMDPEFFGISPREATWVDPQQRLLMEVGWEALERAGWQSEKIGEDTGVFVGWMHNDYQNEASDSFLNLNPYIATGAAGSFLSGRLAYYLGLQGPSLAVDTACSSSLVALHLACQSLQRGDCNRALVGGVNAIVSPTTNILTCKLKALSPSGHSRAFDAAADGYLRGEGCGVVTVRRLSDAERDGDPILGIIRGTAVGHNGASTGLTAPNPKAQEKVIRQALERAGVEPGEVAYLEAHGTGTELGDPIEMQAAAAALAQGRNDDQPLLIGSVKTNIGHLEAAAGMAGLIKVLLAIEHQQIPAQLNFEDPNPHIPWDKLAVKVVSEPTAWPKTDGKQIANLSAFGMSGTNAHVVIEAPQQPTNKPPRTGPVSEGSDEKPLKEPQLLVLSGKNETALQTIAENLGRQLDGNTAHRIEDVAYTSCLGRSHMERRAALVVHSKKQAITELKTLARLGTSESVFVGSSRRQPKVAWQFTGQGSQYVGMARGLYETHEVFRKAVDHCEQLLQQRRNESLTEVLFEHPERIHHTSWTQPGIFAVQMGLAKLLESWGLQPDVVLGHSVGQYAAACVAGIMSWDDGLHLISERGRLIGELPTGGQMLAVFAPLAEVEKELRAHPEVSLAALNGTHIVVSGRVEAVKNLKDQFTERGIRTKALTTSHAFHSALMEPALEPFRKIADQVAFQPGQLPLVCNVSGEALAADVVLDGDYWANHIRQPVRYAEGIDAAQQLGCDLVLELGPQSVLTRMAAANWKKHPTGLISCLQKDSEDTESFLRAVGQVFAHGASPDFDAIFAGKQVNRVVLPTYPFQRRRFWGPDKPRAFHAEFHTAHPLLGSKIALAGVTNETRHESFVEADSPPWLPDHEVMGQVVVPGATYVEMALAAAGLATIKDLVFEQPLRPTSRTALQSIIRTDDAGVKTLEVFSAPSGEANWTRNFTCKIAVEGSRRSDKLDKAELEAQCAKSVSPDDFYRKMQQLGLNYGPKFQTIESLRYSKTDVLAHLSTNGDIRGFTIPPTLLDGALHSLAVGLLRDEEDHLFLPVGIGRVDVFQAIESEVWCHARWTQSEGERRTADITLFTEAGHVVAEIENLQVQQISRAALRQLSGAGSERLIYDLAWQDFRLPAPTNKQTSWLFVDTASDCPSAVESAIDKLTEAGHTVVRLSLSDGAHLEQLSPTHFSMCAENLENWPQLFDRLAGEAPYVPDGIAWFFSGEPESTIPAAGTPSSATKSNCSGVLNLLATLTDRGVRRLECGLQLVTASGVGFKVGAEATSDAKPQQAQYWGLGRVIGAEQPEFRCRLIDLPAEQQAQPNTTDALTEILLTETQDSQLVIRDQQLSVPRMKQTALPRQQGTGLQINHEASYLITGGLGMLGRQAAKWLAEKGAKQVVLVSRRAPDESAQAFIDSIAELGCDVIVHSANMSSATDVESLFQRFGSDLNPLAGVIHAAGVLDDSLLGDQSWPRFEKVLAPKIIGADLLHEQTKSLSLDFFVMYSSAASVLGSPGQSNYATANAYLDGLAWHRVSLGLPALSINWGPWTEGMADDERLVKRLALQGITPLTVAEAHDAMAKMLAGDVVQATVIDADWQRMRMGLGGESPAVLANLTAGKQKSQAGDSELVGTLKRLRGTAQKELLVKTIQNALQVILSTSELPETDRPLIEMGLDSLMAVEFGTELQMLLGDQFGISPTMLFDHPTVDAIADHVLELIAADSTEESPTSEVSSPSVVEKTIAEREDVAIVGISCRFPGARNVHEYWENLLNQVDSVRDIPEDRWDIERFYSADREPGKMYTREGGFLEDIGDFDADFFNISDQEACWIDPQHRMLLENSYRALEDAGIAPHPLTDANVGVFMGIMGQDYAFLPSLDDEEIVQAFQGAGLSHSAGVGRISYMFGFEGPSVAVDTASSSSLVALIQAVRNLQDGNCNMALAGGVNAILAPVNSLLMSKAGLLSPDGRCRSFSAGANGFGRGEGCGVVVLKRLSDAERDGDRVMAVVRGGAVVHNGLTSGITSPSGKAQSRVISAALKDAGIAPSQVQYLEAHGTGTEYGDPMELGAAASVYGKGRQPDQPLLVGSVKANISHLEAAGGVSGLIKTVLALHRGVIPPQLHFDEPSPHIPWDRLPLKMVDAETVWPVSEERIASITALGLVGTNAHVILSAPTTDTEAASLPTEIRSEADGKTTQRTAQLMVLSARNSAALEQMANDYSKFIALNESLKIADVCHTLAVGRRHYEHRVAFTTASREETLQKLSVLTVNDTPSHTVQRNGEVYNNGHAATNGAASSRQHNPQSADIAMNISKSVPKIAWIFTGDSQSDVAHARELYQTEPVFQELITNFDARLADHSKTTNLELPRLVDWLNGNDDLQDVSDLHVFALQAGLAKLWESWGIEPEIVAGFGIGQYTATCVAGGLCFLDALTLIVEREEITQHLRALSADARHSLLTSELPPELIELLDQFEAFADTLNYYPPNLPLVCSLDASTVPVHRSLGGSYWRRHCLESPSLPDTMQLLADSGCDHVLEIGTDGSSLQSDVKENDALWLQSLSHGQTAINSLLDVLGQLYVDGALPDFHTFNSHWAHNKISLPTYPFQKKRYWITEIADHEVSSAIPVES